MDLFSLKNFTKISIFILAGKRLGKNQLPAKPQRKELMTVNNDNANNIKNQRNLNSHQTKINHTYDSNYPNPMYEEPDFVNTNV